MVYKKSKVLKFKSKKFLKRRKLNKAFFLDRDGVINHEIGYIKSWKKIKLYKNTLKALKKINDRNYLIIIITNQSIIARKIAKKSEIDFLHKCLKKFLKKKNINLSSIYICPHHPKFNIRCNCRKPNNGLILKAKKKFNIDLKRSWLIGDKTSDIKAGKKSGLKTILVKTGYGGLDKKYKVKPDYVFKNLYEAVLKLNY